VSRQIKIERFAFSERFKAELQKLQPDVIEAVKKTLELLQNNPEAKSLRLHPLTGLPKPTVWKIDVLPITLGKSLLNSTAHRLS